MASARWILPAIDSATAEDLAAALGTGALVARVLAARGFTDVPTARRFLRPSLDHLHDPFAMRDMEAAAVRLAAAIREREKILIYGDYDTDGTVAVVLLAKAIEMAGGIVSYRVPDRFTEGYGLRTEALEEAAAAGVRLLVSVDTGIRAADAVRRARELGLDVIITDHHLPDSELPPAIAVLNPNRPDCDYPEKNLCGAAVAWKLAQALAMRLDWPEERRRKLGESLLKMAAIATVADVVPLTGENRVIVRHGLAGLGTVRNHGLRALLEVAGFTQGRAPTARQIAFQIAPRINAAGRMDTARDAVELFLTRDPERARELARRLHEQNAERQRVEAETVEACAAMPVDPAAAALVFFDETWHRGVLGIVASRLVERLRRPVFVLGLNDADGLAGGSGRSIPAFHLLEALEAMPDLFQRFGGHKYAAGVTLETARVPEFRERFNAWAAARLGPEDFLPVIRIDAVLDLREAGEQTTRDLAMLAPFGHGNPPPLLAALDVEVAATPIPWHAKHLRVTLRQNGRTLALKAWNFGPRAPELPAGARVDAAFTLEEDAWSAERGGPGWCAVLRDVRPAAAAAGA